MTEATRTERVTARARFDLNCDDVTIAPIEATTYGAIGCGHRASYVMARCDDNYYETACMVTLDGIGAADGPVSRAPAP